MPLRFVYLRVDSVQLSLQIPLRPVRVGLSQVLLQVLLLAREFVQFALPFPALRANGFGIPSPLIQELLVLMLQVTLVRCMRSLPALRYDSHICPVPHFYYESSAATADTAATCPARDI